MGFGLTGEVHEGLDAYFGIGIPEPSARTVATDAMRMAAANARDTRTVRAR
jgi:hypothetical protein